MKDDKLKEVERQFKEFVSKSPDAHAMLDRDFNYIAVSDSWYETYHIEEKDITGKNHYDYFPEAKKKKDWLDIHHRALSGETIENKKEKFVRDNGRVQFLSWKVAPWYRGENNIGGVLMYTRDLTSEVKLENKLKDLNSDLEKKIEERTEKLRRVNKELESFSYSVSHDLRAPLRAINGFSGILIEDYSEELDSEPRRLLGVIRQNALKMGELIDDILHFSRLEKKELHTEVLDLNWLVAEVVKDVQQEYQHCEVSFTCNKLPSVYGDLPTIRQVFINLLSNAFKYSSKKEEPEVEVGSMEAEKKNMVSIYIKDNGIGFDMKYYDKIFKVFQRLHSDDEFEGTGVGLALVNRIINRHGGELWAKSEPGKGATFCFSLPATEEK